MSFQFGATTDKAAGIRKALTDQRDQQLKSDEYNDSRASGVVDDVQVRRDELEGDLADAGIAAAEAAARKLKDAGSYQVTVSGHRNPDGVQAVSVSINAAP